MILNMRVPHNIEYFSMVWMHEELLRDDLKLLRTRLVCGIV